VRQAAAQALERIADSTVLDGLLDSLEDPSVTVRFNLVGALGHAAGDGRSLSAEQRTRLLERLEGLLLRDADPGVRSRAATVLGECALPAVLPVLWGRVTAAEDSRVQEKAWGAFLQVLARSASLELVQEWEQKMTQADQPQRRLEMLGEVYAHWHKRDDTRARAAVVQELLVQGHLDQGKWAAAFPLVRDLLARPGGDAEVAKRLRWLLVVGEQALKEGNRPEALRVVQEAQPHLARCPALVGEFEQLDKAARPHE
jgi:HEAT repeat protein